MRYILTSEYDFAAAHYLKGHQGKCKNLHGHNYLVKIEVGAEELQETGSSRAMVVDFYDIKQEFRALLDSLDHATHLENDKFPEPTHSYVDVVIDDIVIEQSHIVWLPFRPTAENYAKFIFDHLVNKGFPVYAITVYETPINACRYTPYE